MLRPGKGILSVAVLGAALVGGSAVMAGPSEGGRNTMIHKRPVPARAAVKCRICAGRNCTVVRVRGRCTKRRALSALRSRLKGRSGRQKALPLPSLDDRSYKQLQKESRRRVPRHTPEWSNLNDSDPGVAILKEARRHPRSVRVQRAPAAALPEPDDEVMLGFEHGDRE